MNVFKGQGFVESYLSAVCFRALYYSGNEYRTDTAYYRRSKFAFFSNNFFAKFEKHGAKESDKPLDNNPCGASFKSFLIIFYPSHQLPRVKFSSPHIKVDK